ncbi:unnamed protein product [Gongylonema pulchrum]|uniref:Uncharacterized protein n=1 Tax=Gongylonema pulchrum TaxID=637853 RepID=A0A183E6E3_9BILA|nr:unnamed protein product [Gongylonema pulchrum]
MQIFAPHSLPLKMRYLGEKPQLLLCTLKRSEEDVKKKGEYRKAYWRHDSSAVCFTVCTFLPGFFN